MQTGDRLTSFCRYQGGASNSSDRFLTTQSGSGETWRDAVLGFRADNAAAAAPIV
jgi:hypothetical protein